MADGPPLLVNESAVEATADESEPPRLAPATPAAQSASARSSATPTSAAPTPPTSAPPNVDQPPSLASTPQPRRGGRGRPPLSRNRASTDTQGPGSSAQGQPRPIHLPITPGNGRQFPLVPANLMQAGVAGYDPKTGQYIILNQSLGLHQMQQAQQQGAGRGRFAVQLAHGASNGQVPVLQGSDGQFYQPQPVFGRPPGQLRPHHGQNLNPQQIQQMFLHHQRMMQQQQPSGANGQPQARMAIPPMAAYQQQQRREAPAAQMPPLAGQSTTGAAPGAPLTKSNLDRHLQLSSHSSPRNVTEWMNGIPPADGPSSAGPTGVPPPMDGLPMAGGGVGVAMLPQPVVAAAEEDDDDEAAPDLTAQENIRGANVESIDAKEMAEAIPLNKPIKKTITTIYEGGIIIQESDTPFHTNEMNDSDFELSSESSSDHEDEYLSKDKASGESSAEKEKRQMRTSSGSNGGVMNVDVLQAFKERELLDQHSNPKTAKREAEESVLPSTSGSGEKKGKKKGSELLQLIKMDFGPKENARRSRELSQKLINIGGNDNAKDLRNKEGREARGSSTTPLAAKAKERKSTRPSRGSAAEKVCKTCGEILRDEKNRYYPQYCSTACRKKCTDISVQKGDPNQQEELKTPDGSEKGEEAEDVKPEKEEEKEKEKTVTPKKEPTPSKRRTPDKSKEEKKEKQPPEKKRRGRAKKDEAGRPSSSAAASATTTPVVDSSLQKEIKKEPTPSPGPSITPSKVKNEEVKDDDRSPEAKRMKIEETPKSASKTPNKSSKTPEKKQQQKAQPTPPPPLPPSSTPTLVAPSPSPTPPATAIVRLAPPSQLQQQAPPMPTLQQHLQQQQQHQVRMAPPPQPPVSGPQQQQQQRPVQQSRVATMLMQPTQHPTQAHPGQMQMQHPPAQIYHHGGPSTSRQQPQIIMMTPRQQQEMMQQQRHQQQQLQAANQMAAAAQQQQLQHQQQQHQQQAANQRQMAAQHQPQQLQQPPPLLPPAPPPPPPQQAAVVAPVHVAAPAAPPLAPAAPQQPPLVENDKVGPTLGLDVRRFRSWSVSDVGRWVELITGRPELVQLFSDEQLDGRGAIELDRTQLRNDLKLPLGQVNRLMPALDEIKRVNDRSND